MLRSGSPFWSGNREVVGAPRFLVIHHTADDKHAEQAALVERNHKDRGYDEGFYGSYIAYHFFIGKDGTVKQNRSLSERTMHTRNEYINSQSIAIALAGNFEIEQPNVRQLAALKNLVATLDSEYHFERIIGHRDASPDACPGKFLTAAMERMHLLRGNESQDDFYSISRYYSPVPGQLKYYRTGPNAYLADVKVNCGLESDGTASDCSTTADGYKLKPEDAYKVAACPPEMPFGTKLQIQGIGVVTCHDHGSAIQKKRLDIWAGFGEAGLKRIYSGRSGIMSVKRL